MALPVAPSQQCSGTLYVCAIRRGVSARQGAFFGEKFKPKIREKERETTRVGVGGGEESESQERLRRMSFIVSNLE